MNHEMTVEWREHGAYLVCSCQQYNRSEHEYTTHNGKRTVIEITHGRNVGGSTVATVVALQQRHLKEVIE